jgi:hypothetical protein
VFQKKCALAVVNLWSDRGEMCGERGQFTVTFSDRKIGHPFQLFFFEDEEATLRGRLLVST